MPLTSGARLGSYTIAARLGAGGMGEVYRATDPKLGREVAIKVLPPEVANDPERLARFQREAQLLAALNHPHIAAIYGLDEAEGKPFLVLELVDGDDLAERLKRGPIPLDEALELGTQMAGALEAAHEKGIVHRDLKPANLKVNSAGQLKILDFGLAKAYRGESTSGPFFDPSSSPTRTEQETTAGTILGTAAYMSPEQARGRAVDKRTDIWAFGVVLHEMLTGRQLFAGETASDTLAAVLTREPDFRDLPAGVPPRVRSLLARCLKKDARERLRDIGDARIELAEKETVAPTPAPMPGPSRRLRKGWLLLGGLLLLAAGVTVGILATRGLLVREPPTFRQLSFGRGFVHTARFAPDGQTILYGAAFEGRPLAVYSTRTDGFESRPLDVGDADVAGISRDGEVALLLGRHHVGTWLRVGRLASVSLSGGTPREILDEVYDADISPDGEQFAVVVQDGDHQVLQYPIGKERFKTDGWISQPRIFPDGTDVAFVHHRVWGDDLGEVKVAEDGGAIVSVVPEYQYMQGLCWTRDGKEVWFAGAEDPGGGVLGRAAPGGPVRLVLRMPTIPRVQEVAPDGRLLVLSDDASVEIAGKLAGDTGERVYTWWAHDSVSGISDDGTVYAGNNASIVVNGEYSMFFRKGGGPPVQLGTGVAAGLTPDGGFVLTTALSNKDQRAKLTLRPLGPGRPRELALGDVEVDVGGGRNLSCASNNSRIAFVGTTPASGNRVFVLDLAVEGTHPRAVSPAGAYSAYISPDGTRVAVGDLKRGIYVVPATPGTGEPVPVPVPGIPKADVPLAWTSDGQTLFSWDRTLPPRLYRTDVSTGRRSLVQEIVPPDPAGLLYALASLSTDGRYHLMRYRKVLSQVYLVDLHDPLSDVFVGVKIGDRHQ